MVLTYGSVCSGIEAASVAWHELPFKPLWFSEIDKFPCSVLATRWPDVPNLGDMTGIAACIRAGGVPAPDLIVGGTPCQAFSVAGVRAGLADPRGQLAISYVDLADAIDETRIAAGKDPAVFVWENVPGVLSSKDNAFGAFLGLLAGEDCELQPPGGRWKNAGFVHGPKRTIAWRILDAQYFGVAQRRQRTFVVASARKDIHPLEILFEFDGLRRDIAPRRSQEKDIAGTLKARATSGGWSQDVDMAASGYMQVVFSPHDSRSIVAQSVSGDIAHTLKARGFDGSEDGTGRGTPVIGTYRMLAMGAYAHDDVASTCKARDGKCATDLAVIAYGFKGGQGARARSIGWSEEQSPTLISASSGLNQAPTVLTAIAFAQNSRNEIRLQGGDGLVSGPLSAGGGKSGQGYPAIAYVGFDILGTPSSEVARASDLHTVLRARTPGQFENSTVTMVSDGLAFRRLTPVECERLQGFPDNHTLIPVNKRKKITAEEFAYLRHHFPDMTAEEAYQLAADGPRYKAIGNSMAVPVMHWIGQRIARAVALL